MDNDKLKARTKWKDVYPLFSDDKRYLDMLGNPGSNPLELFWDAVDSMDQKLDAKIAIAEAAFKRYNDNLTASVANEAEEVKLFKLTPDTTLEEFSDVVKMDSSDVVQKLKPPELVDVFTTVRPYPYTVLSFLTWLSQMHEQALKQQADEKRRAERKQRHLQDDLRYALRKLSEPFDINLSYEEVHSLSAVSIGC